MIVNSNQDLCLPSSSDKLSSHQLNKMELSHACRKESSDVPSLMSLMTLREGCLEKPQNLEETTQPNVMDSNALLAVLDGMDLLDMSSSPHSPFLDSSERSRRTLGRLNSMVPVRKPERRPSCESFTGEEGSSTFHESSANAVFDLMTPEQRTVRRSSDHLLMPRATSIPADIALCKPKRKSSSDNLFDLPKRRQARHSCGSFMLTR